MSKHDQIFRQESDLKAMGTKIRQEYLLNYLLSNDDASYRAYVRLCKHASNDSAEIVVDRVLRDAQMVIAKISADDGR